MTTQILRSKLDDFFDSVAERVESLVNRLTVPDNFGWMEFISFLFPFRWMIWMVLFDVSASSKTYDYIYNQTLWIAILAALAVLHVVGVVRNSMKMRRRAVFGYAVIWFMWAILSSLSNFASPAGTGFLITSLMAVVVAVRLPRENNVR